MIGDPGLPKRPSSGPCSRMAHQQGNRFFFQIQHNMKRGRRRAAPTTSSVFQELDIATLVDVSVWNQHLPGNHPILILDPPWQRASGNTSNTNRYSSMPNDTLMELARGGLSAAFVPSAEEPCGLLAVWCVLETEELALDMLRAAGYQLFHKAMWGKLSKDDELMSHLAFGRANAEMLVVGLKGTRPSRNGKSVKQAGATLAFEIFCGQPSFDVLQREGQRLPAAFRHSSKPVEVYSYLEELFSKFCDPNTDIQAASKVELFGRYLTVGYTTVGNQYACQRMLSWYDTHVTIPVVIVDGKRVSSTLCRRAAPRPPSPNSCFRAARRLRRRGAAA